MTIKKIIIYQKNSTKPVVLTDENDQSLQELKDKIMSVFNSDKIFVLETKNDLLIGRPSDLQSILISNSNNIENTEDNKRDKNSKYDKGLTLDAKPTNS